MKIMSECIPCLIERAKFECDIVFNDDAKKIEVLSEVLSYISGHFSPEAVPAALGTQRERIIKKASGMHDPYIELKKKSNEIALELLPFAKKFYENSDDPIRGLIKIAATANSMEYGVKGYEYKDEDFQEKFEEALKEELVGDLSRIKEAFEKYQKILYLTDNAGEIIFDKFIAEKMLELGKEVIISPKIEPIINDATVEDIMALNFNDFKIVPSGSYVGLSLEEAPEDFLKLFWDKKYLIFAKGMGYYETLSEIEERLRGRLIYVFRAKCISVASSAGVKQGALVAKLV